MNENERTFLSAYHQGSYPRPAVTVDLTVFTLLDADLKVLLIRRLEPPFQGHLALPGGFVRVGDGITDQGEDLDAAARRELEEETGLPPGELFLEQLYTFGRAGRDPRTRVITVAYYALISPSLAPLVRPGGDAAAASWHSLCTLDVTKLAFDHAEILKRALERIAGRIDDSNIAFELVPDTFTISELRSVHEVVKGKAYDPGNFRKRFQRMLADGVIEMAPGRRITASKPAKVFRFVRVR